MVERNKGTMRDLWINEAAAAAIGAVPVEVQEAEVSEDATNGDLSDHTVEALLEMAAEAGVTVPSKAKKAEIIALLAGD